MPKPDNARWNRIKEIVADALEVPPEARSEVIDHLSGGDPEIRSEVEALLRAAEGEDPLLDSEITVTARGLARNAVEEVEARAPKGEPESHKDDEWLAPGTKLGPYRLIARLGEGGMGVVFEAEQDEPRRRVALKVLQGARVSSELRRRFRREIEILATLKHPAIAQVWDAGVARDPASGFEVPYFTMEIIEGRPLGIAVRELGLGVREKLELVARICAAVEHAHQRGVIHRDLKPDNILVDGNGEPRILDFGIARMLDSNDPSQSLQTESGKILGTLAYMSPEQVRGDPREVDTRADVYALGVILYELLAGHLPIETRGRPIPDALRAVLVETPIPLGRIDRAFRGDIETIVSTALAKERAGRYSSASELRADIVRFLRDEAITARPPSTLYVLRKLARRHRAVAVGLVVAIVGFGAGAFGIVAGWVRAEAERERAVEAEREAVEGWQKADAERERAVLAEAEARAGQNFLRTLLEGADPEVFGRDVLLVDLLSNASIALEGTFPDRPSVRASLHSTLGWTYYSLGRHEEAEAELREAWKTCREALGDAHRDSLETLSRLTQVLVDLGKLDEAERLIDRGVELAGSLPHGSEVRFVLSRTRASILYERGEIEESRKAYDELLAQGEAAFGPDYDLVLGTRNDAALVHLAAGRVRSGEELLRKTLTARERSLGKTHPRTLLTRLNLAQSLHDNGEHATAEREYRALLELGIPVWGPGHPHSLRVKSRLGSLLAEAGRLDDALELAKAAHAESTDAFGPRHPVTLGTLNVLSITLLHAKRYDEAEPYCRELAVALTATHGADHPSTWTAIDNHASALDGLGRLKEALELSQKVVEWRMARDGEASIGVLIAQNNLAKLLEKMEKPEEAIEIYDRALANARKAHPDHPVTELYLAFNRARCLLGVGRRDDAAPDLRAAWEKAQSLPEDHAMRQKIEAELERFLDEGGSAAEREAIR